jgi:hypothetical protein
MQLVGGKPLKLKSKVDGQKSLYFVHSPKDQTVGQGEEAVVQCEAAPAGLVTDCQWSREGAALGAMAHLPRHSMRGCSLVIRPVQPEDEGEYRCQVAGRGAAPLLSRGARLTVRVEPGLPAILEAREGDWVEAARGEELLLTCESQGGRPYAELQWRDAEGQLILGHVQEHITRIEGTASFKTVSTLRFSPVEPMAVTCTAHSEAFPEVKRSRALAVQLRRDVKEEIVKLETGADIRLTCDQSGGSFKWMFDDNEVEGETGSSLFIEDFTPEYDNTVVKCLQEKFGGEARLLKLVRLVHLQTPQDDPSVFKESKKPKKLVKGAKAVGLQVDQPPAPAIGKMKNVFTCVSEGEDEGEPEFVWVNGKLEKRMTRAMDSTGNKFKCRLVPGGMKRVRQMEKKLRLISKDLRRFSKVLKRFTSPLA